jgi:hypothetical protein
MYVLGRLYIVSTTHEFRQDLKTCTLLCAELPAVFVVVIVITLFQASGL